MTGQTTIEKVARVIAAAQSKQHAYAWEPFAPLARAVLEAVRRPTDVVEKAGYDRWLSVGGGPCIEAIWEAMIDAALEEKP